ncbi:hypothetical protein FGO68_gene11040 [Halteria grandinella]|uniref:Calcium-dependent protein kinase 1 n=1 Tax=Halteria grandinella TaxID=5974 RepID=A0A8J8NV43_HALGN|nr:hypothetical protein FGO68_gene11040 [Halteria grandinella]
MGSCMSSNTRTESTNKVAPTASGADSTKGTETTAGGPKRMTASDITLSKKQFVFEHVADNIRDDYLIGKVLGTGAFGEVRLCTHRKTGAKRAVKIIKKSFLQGKEETRFLQEIEILKQMDHPNIVRMFEVYQDPKRYFIVTEHCSGGELFDQIIKRPYYSERDAANIMKQALSAISYCHSMKIVHRDLKPENLLLDSEGDKAVLKVIDFGTSQTFDPTQKMHQTFGTPYYIAPEILSGEYTESCDVWSCGVILYILLCGKPPFDGESDEDILKNVQKGVYKISGPIWSRVSPDGTDLVKKMLKFDPERRISASSALMHPWIQNNTENMAIEDAQHSDAMKNLQSFNASNKLASAALTFMTTHMISTEEMRELQKTFEALDTTKDGRLSREELLDGYTKLMGQVAAELEVERIMNSVDVDKNGTIDYSEFITATMNKDKLLTGERLKNAFDYFDKNKSGFINLQEIKMMLDHGRMIDERVWKELIQSVDLNGDGEISFAEFQKMMEQLIGKVEPAGKDGGIAAGPSGGELPE